jgi:hypothetical protein
VEEETYDKKVLPAPATIVSDISQPMFDSKSLLRKYEEIRTHAMQPQRLNWTIFPRFKQFLINEPLTSTWFSKLQRI